MSISQRFCSRCRLHGFKKEARGHKNQCLYSKCVCYRCESHKYANFIALSERKMQRQCEMKINSLNSVESEEKSQKNNLKHEKTSKSDKSVDYSIIIPKIDKNITKINEINTKSVEINSKIVDNDLTICDDESIKCDDDSKNGNESQNDQKSNISEDVEFSILSDSLDQYVNNDEGLKDQNDQILLQQNDENTAANQDHNDGNSFNHNFEVSIDASSSYNYESNYNNHYYAVNQNYMNVNGNSNTEVNVNNFEADQESNRMNFYIERKNLEEKSTEIQANSLESSEFNESSVV